MEIEDGQLGQLARRRFGSVDALDHELIIGAQNMVEDLDARLTSSYAPLES